VIENTHGVTLSRAKEFAKPKWIKVWDEHKSKYDFETYEKKESSIFFFIWTQYEREIREAMMSCFDISEACHQVHDAVYSKELVETSVIEATVLEQTGFTVKIAS